MKLSANTLVTGGLLATIGLLGAQAPAPSGGSNTHGDPFTPVGFLTVTPTVVQPGVQPEMTWGIEYPQSIPDLVVIDTAGGMTTQNDKSDKVTVRVAGVSFSTEGTDLPVALWVRIDSGPWNLVFYGTETQVDAGAPVYQQSVTTGTRVDLAARGRTVNGNWTETQWTLSSSPNVAALIDGSPLPTESSAFTTGETEGFMSQYIDGNNEIVAGPRDVIHVFEVGSSTPGNSLFDMQDIVVVTTFGKTNNGHGNNDDGYDVSNPGSGSGVGGVGDTTTDPETGEYIDDERLKIKKK
jgi:hypothetical protein